MKFNEQGTSGLQEYSGYIQEAYNKTLYWPAVQPLYARLRRSDPEVSVVRNIFTALARSVKFRWELPDEPTSGDQAAQEFAETVLDDIEGGASAFLESVVGNVPFFGWGWWEVLPGYRDPKWKAPNGDPWQSTYNDKKIGIRRLAWRDSSSFEKWEFADNGQLKGMWQYALPSPQAFLPIENSLHLTYGDAHNPEGLSPLEAVWRLERIKYGLEVVQGIGFEHSAGYLSVTAENTLTPADLVEIKKAARAIMTAQEGNYAAWPSGVTGELLDVDFAAAPAILEAIKYFGILKLTVFCMQWVALSAVSGSGSFAAMSDSSNMAVMIYNAMLEGFASQMDNQIGKRLFTWNEFPGMVTRPRLKIDPVNKISLEKLAAILAPLNQVMKFGDEDIIAIRKQTGFMPETLPEIESPQTPPEPEPIPEEQADEEEPQSAEVQGDAESTAETVQQSLIRWKAYAEKHDRKAFAELNRKVEV